MSGRAGDGDGAARVWRGSPIGMRAGVGPCRGDGRPLVRLPPWPNPTVYSIFSKGTYLRVGALEISKVLSKYHSGSSLHH